ncbi:MAG: NADH-ubiquinone oxidoreductase-F iron-sulfur binding region domain-containing protein [Lachnospiraceae bacterium]|nr:NADH-ubiquinone oxidoreductase-F iron-sulfur binding region domain-containing protein [Lachnospiraceae bacterium]
MSAFDWNKVEVSGLSDYGLFSGKIADRLKEVKEASQAKEICPRVLCGLNNADRDHAYLDILKQDPAAVIDGILACAEALGAKETELYLPENESELAESLKGSLEEKGIALKTGIIDVREHADDFIIHIAGAADLASLLGGELPDGRFFKANGEIKRLDPSTPLKEVLDLSDAKAIWNGYTYLTLEEAEEVTVGDCPTGTALPVKKTQCIVEETKKALQEDRKISCGKCVFCREGLIQLEYEQNEITQGRGKTEFEDYAEEIGAAMHSQTLCSIGQKSGDAALSAFAKFSDEYDQHIKKNNCPAGVCTAFSHIYIDPMTCTGCGDCLDVCPVDAILGKPRYIHMIEDLDCTRCGKCLDVCEEDAIVRASGKLPKLPQRLVKVGKFKRH